jgi:hypothetical protein
METFSRVSRMLRKTKVGEDQENGHPEQIYQDQPWPVPAQDLTSKSESKKGKQRVPATPNAQTQKEKNHGIPSITIR